MVGTQRSPLDKEGTPRTGSSDLRAAVPAAGGGCGAAEEDDGVKAVEPGGWSPDQTVPTRRSGGGCKVAPGRGPRHAGGGWKNPHRGGGKEPHRRRNHKVEQLSVLTQWFKAHVDEPYPTPDEKVTLATQAGMEVQQICLDEPVCVDSHRVGLIRLFMAGAAVRALVHEPAQAALAHLR